MSLNAKYIVLFKSPRDRSQIRHLAQQIYPEDVKFVQEVFEQTMILPHLYLFLDLSQKTLDELRFRSCIFPDGSKNYAYIPKKSNVPSLICRFYRCFVNDILTVFLFLVQQS